MQYFAPDYELDVRPSNMENANSADYLHKIKSSVIESIRRTGKPSVEAFTNIPDNPPQLGGYDSDAEEEMNDLDADENPDVRATQRQRDQQIEAEGELYDQSDDEDYKDSLGVRRQPGEKRRRNILDFQNPNADDGDETPNGARTLNGESARRRRSASLASSAQAPNGTASRARTPVNAADADKDGDVEMDEAEGAIVPEESG